MAGNRVINVGLVQMSMSADADENVRKAVARVAEAKKAGADVVCLPELYRSPYFCQKEDARLFDLADPVPGPSTEALGRAAREAGVVGVAPIFQRHALRPFHNPAVLVHTNGHGAGR